MKADLSRYFVGKVVNLTTYSDMTSSFISPLLYQKKLQSAGFIPPEITSSASPQYLGRVFRNTILKLIMNPKEDLCKLVNGHLDKLKQRHVIGLQIRNGGQVANYKETIFLGQYAVEHFYNEVIRYLKFKHLQPKDVYVVISTDSTLVANRLTELFQKLEPTMVYTITDFKIGHSAPGKTFIKQGKSWNDYNDRAILDLLILKDSDFLVFSEGSSYGQFAHELQQTYNNPISVNAFLQSKGLTCSVFNRVNGSGVARKMLKKRTRRNVPLSCYKC